MSGFHVFGQHADRNRELRLQTADIGRSRPPRWAWRRRVVIGQLNLLLGNEGIGKGALVAWLIARLTLGELDGDLKGTRVNVGIVGDEDDLDSVWTPRLHAAGAELDRICQIERPDGGLVVVREDRKRLARLVRDTGIRILYFDQVLDNLGAGVDDWRQKQLRDAIAPLRALARELEIAALGTMHPNKRGSSFRELVSGAPAFNATSRSSLLLAQHPEDENLRVLVRGKGNLSERPTPLEFEIASHTFEANGHEFSVPVARGFRPSEIDVDELIGPDAGKATEHGQAADAREIIEVLLARDGQWHSSAPIYQACASEGISERTVKRAKQQLGVEHRRVPAFPATSSEWRWPAAAGPDDKHAGPVPTVPTVPTAGASRAGGGSKASKDSEDRANALTDPGRTADATPNGAAIDAKAAIEADLRRELEGELP